MNDGTFTTPTPDGERIAANAITDAEERAAIRHRVAVERERLVLAIGDRIGTMMIERGLNAARLSVMSGLPQRQIARLRTGVLLGGPDAYEMRLLAHALGVSPAWLAWGIAPRSGR